MIRTVLVLGMLSLAAPAAAQYRATMIVGHVPAADTGDGTERFGFTSTDFTTPMGSLSPSSFRYDARTYDVHALLTYTIRDVPVLYTSFSRTLPPQSIIVLDGVSFALGDALETAQTEIENVYAFRNPFTWTEGDTVPVSIRLDPHPTPALPLAGVLALFALLALGGYRRLPA